MKGVSIGGPLQVSQLARLGKALRIPAAAAVALLMSGIAGAFAAPAVGSFGYDVYDIVVNQILNGPIGFIGGVILIVFGATQIIKNWMLTIMCVIAGTVLIRAEDLVITLGAMVAFVDHVPALFQVGMDAANDAVITARQAIAA